MTYSKAQEIAIEEIVKMTDVMGIDRWFIQEEIRSAGYSTIMALVNKQYLRTKYVNSMSYYQIVESICVITPNCDACLNSEKTGCHLGLEIINGKCEGFC